MKRATVRDLRNDFGRVSKWVQAGETVQILKRGKPFARVVPEPRVQSFFGAGAGAVRLPPDIDDSIAVVWEASE